MLSFLPVDPLDTLRTGALDVGDSEWKTGCDLKGLRGNTSVIKKKAAKQLKAPEAPKR